MSETGSTWPAWRMSSTSGLIELFAVAAMHCLISVSAALWISTSVTESGLSQLQPPRSIPRSTTALAKSKSSVRSGMCSLLLDAVAPDLVSGWQGVAEPLTAAPAIQHRLADGLGVVVAVDALR